MTKDSEGNEIPGSDEEVQLTKVEYDELTQKLASKAQAEANMTAELIDLRKKNRELSGQSQGLQSEDVSKVVEEELKKRDAEELKRVKEALLGEFLDSHPEFAKEADADGSRFAAYQQALGRISLNGVKTKEDYASVLDDAFRLMERKESMPNNYSSTPISVSTVPGSKTSARLNEKETKLVQNNFGGDIEKFLAMKAKRPAYVEELLNWVR